MKLVAITVSVNYSDFLVHAIRYNKEYFDEWIIVTDTKDIETKKLCEENNLTCLQTDIFYTNGKFRKFAAINEALQLVDNNSWVVFIDGDILLSKWTRRVLDKLNLDKKKIYGIDRVNCYGYEDFLKFETKEGVVHNNWLLHGASLEFGARIIHIYGDKDDKGNFTGWKPLGFFQLCHKSAFSEYPEGQLGDASHGDMEFAKLWSRENRELIPEIIGVHICTTNYASMNWKGRKSDPFMVLPWYKRLYYKIRRKLKNYI